MAVRPYMLCKDEQTMRNYFRSDPRPIDVIGEQMTAAEQVERIFRKEHGRVLAALISRFEDFDLAEDALQDALVNALERWQRDGIPENPAAWLTAVARRRAIDRIRRTAALEQSLPFVDAPLSYDE